jgi:hypothetical protein
MLACRAEARSIKRAKAGLPAKARSIEHATVGLPNRSAK